MAFTVKAPGLRPKCAERNRPQARDERVPRFVLPTRPFVEHRFGHRGLPHGCGQAALSPEGIGPGALGKLAPRV
jgi:hypothetical protein